MSEETQTAKPEKFKVVPVKWDAKRIRIPMKFRASTLEAIESLDKNMFPNRTDFIERLIENYLIKKGFLKKNPHPTNHVTQGAKSRGIIEWNDKKVPINYFLRTSTLKAINNLDKNIFPNRTDFIERVIENYLIKKKHLAKNSNTVEIAEETSKAA